METATDCPVCHGTGEWTGKLVKSDGSFEYRFGQECPNEECNAGRVYKAQRDQQRLQQLFSTSQAPARFIGATLTDFAPEVAERVTNAAAKGKGIYVVGPVGVGKTHLLIAAFKALFAAHKTCLYVPVPDFLTKLRASYNIRPGRRMETTEHETEADILAACRGADWLGLDDLGAESQSDWSRQMVYQVINGRYMDTKPVIVTSNLTLNALASPTYLGERGTSRLREMCDVVALVGRDRRIREAADVRAKPA